MDKLEAPAEVEHPAMVGEGQADAAPLAGRVDPAAGDRQHDLPVWREIGPGVYETTIQVPAGPGWFRFNPATGEIKEITLGKGRATMGKDDEKQFVWLKTPPKMYGLFEISDEAARVLALLAFVVTMILLAIWLL